MEKLHDICAMKKKLIEWAQEAMANGPDTVDTSELGEVVDMIKDLYEAELYCYEACYYQTVTEAMEDGTETLDKASFWMNRAGMKWRPEKRFYADDPYWDQGRMGYTPHTMTHNEIGRNWDHYMNARRHYQTTKADSDKREMSTSAQMHVGETIATLREVWQDADPDLRQKMKKDFTNLLQEMT